MPLPPPATGGQGKNSICFCQAGTRPVTMPDASQSTPSMQSQKTKKAHLMHASIRRASSISQRHLQTQKLCRQTADKWLAGCRTQTFPVHVTAPKQYTSVPDRPQCTWLVEWLHMLNNLRQQGHDTACWGWVQGDDPCRQERVQGRDSVTAHQAPDQAIYQMQVRRHHQCSYNERKPYTCCMPTSQQKCNQKEYKCKSCTCRQTAKHVAEWIAE